MVTTKATARARGKQLRAKLSEEIRLARDAQVIELALRSLDWASYKRVHLYLPIHDKGEISTWALLRWLWEKNPGTATHVPVIRDGVMSSLRLSSRSLIGAGPFGVPEPVDEPSADAGMFDLVIVPMLAFDDIGQRVGYGRGYYDQFLATQANTMAVGLAYEDWKVEGRIAAEPHDIRLNAVITEKKMHRFNSASYLE